MNIPASRWWFWVAGGVAWGLLCVGVRHAALATGRDIQVLLGRRAEALARVQQLERTAAEAKRLEVMERLARRRGFIKPAAFQVVIVPPVEEPGLLARWLGRPSETDKDADLASPDVPIRPREEVLASRRFQPKPAKPRRTRRKR